MENNKPKRHGIRDVPKYKPNDRVEMGKNTYHIVSINELLGTYDIRLVNGFGIFTWLSSETETVSTRIIDGFHSMKVTAMNSYTDDINFNRVIEVNGEEVLVIQRKNLKILAKLYGKEAVVDRITKAFKDQLERKVLA